MGQPSEGHTRDQIENGGELRYNEMHGAWVDTRKRPPPTSTPARLKATASAKKRPITQIDPKVGANYVHFMGVSCFPDCGRLRCLVWQAPPPNKRAPEPESLTQPEVSLHPDQFAS